MTITQFLDDALDIFGSDGENWVNHDPVKYIDPCKQCVATCLCVVDIDATSIFDKEALVITARNLLITAIPSSFVFDEDSRKIEIAQYNDSLTNFEDVKAWFAKAHELATANN